MIFGLSPSIFGGIAGVALGLVSMVIVLSIARRVEDGAKSDEHRRTARLLRGIAWLDVFLFGAIGYFVGPMIFG